MLFKIFFLFIIALNLGLPLNTEIDVVFILITFTILFRISNENYKHFYKSKLIIFLIIVLSISNQFVPKFFTQELHQIFVNKNDLKIISKILPKEINKKIKKDFLNNFDNERFVKSNNWNLNDIKEKNFIKYPIAFSSDSFFQKNKFSRINSKLNFNSREDLRIGQINSLIYNLPFDKEFRRILPYVVLFELDQIFNKTNLCYEGNVYISDSNTAQTVHDIKYLNFVKAEKNKCIDLIFDSKYKYILAYSINENDNLKIDATYNFNIYFLKFIKYIILIIILFLFYSIGFKQKNTFDSLIYFISAASSLILTLVRDSNLLFGLRYYRGGADGLAHYSWGKEILENFSNQNFYLALEGGEKIFYFMPGLRYFSALNNLLFGETSYGYLIACTFIPLLIFKIFEKLINRKIAVYLFLSFIFIPIFENMGFGYFNYIWQYARHHAESLSILFLLYSLFLIISITKEKNHLSPYYLIGILLSSSTFLRPNFFPTTLILFFLCIFLLYKNKNYLKIIPVLLGYSLIFVCFVHNLYFGDSYVFFTQAAVNFNLSIGSFFDALFAVIKLDFENENLSILKSQLAIWNPIYNFHRIIILCYIVYIVISKKISIIFYALFLSLISQHGLLLLSHPSSRYAYLAWLITFIIFTFFITKISFKKIR